MGKQILFFLEVILGMQNAFAGGFTWSCQGEWFSAQWNGKPLRPVGGEIHMIYLPEKLEFYTKLSSVDELNENQILHLDGNMGEAPVHVDIESQGMADIKMSVSVKGQIVESNIKCGLF